MATCREIITSAHQKLMVTALGETPAAEEGSLGLVVLQSLYDGLLTNGTFGRLTDVLVSSDYTAGENERITITSGLPTITRPTTIEDEHTGEDRPPRDCSVIVQAGASPTVHIYSAMRGEWVQMSDLGLSDFAPLSERSRDGLAAMLAVKIADEYGGNLKPGTAHAAAVFHSGLTHRRDSARTETQADYF